MNLSRAALVLVASTLLPETVAAEAFKPNSVVGETNTFESRSLQVAYTLADQVDLGTGDNTCQWKRYSKISDTRRLATMDCDSYFATQSRINVYEFNDKEEQYLPLPIFTTDYIHPKSNSAFSPDGKTIVTVNASGCGVGKIWKDEGGVFGFPSWQSTDITFFPCDGTIPSNFPGQFEMGINYDGTMFAIGSGDGAVFVFELQNETTWEKIYEYVDSGRLDGTQRPYSTCFVNLSRDGKKLLYTDFRSNADDSNNNLMILKYLERSENGSWSTPIEVPTIATGGYDARGYFTPDGSRLVVSTVDSGIKVFDYDGAGSWTLVKTFTDNRFNSGDGAYMVDISNSGKRIIYCGQSMVTSTVVTFDEDENGNWNDGVFWGTQRSNGGCTIDGSGGIMVVSTINDGALNAYRDNTIDFTIEYNPPPNMQLPAKFILPSPNCTVDSDISPGTVTCASTGIDGPSNAMMSMQVLGYNCVTPYDPNSFGSTNVSVGTVETELNGATSFNAIAQVDYTSGYDGSVEFCVRTDLNDISGENMRFRSEKVNMTFTYDGIFTVDSFATETYDGIGADDTTAIKEFGVTAYICDSQGTKNDSPGALSIGTNLFVCIETNDKETKVASLVFFRATKATAGGDETLEIDETNSNVVITGIDTEKVIAVINFPVRFFSDVSPIVINGNVLVQQKGRRRLTSPREYARGLQENESGEVEFGLLIDVVTDESSATRHDIIATIFAGLVSFLLV